MIYVMDRFKKIGLERPNHWGENAVVAKEFLANPYLWHVPLNSVLSRDLARSICAFT